MLRGLEQAAGAVVLLLVLGDIFLTVLYARADTGLITYHLARFAWRAFRTISKPFARYPDFLLSFCGPSILVLLVLTWALLLTLGAALILHPGLGSGIQANQGDTPTDFITAMYVAGNSMSIVGSSGFSPKTGSFQLLFLFFSLVGLSAISLTLTYVMQVYTALLKRNVAGLAADLMSAQTGDAAELLAGIGPGAQFTAGYTNLANLASAVTEVKEAHHFYPVLFYFRFADPVYSVSRLCTLTLDTTTLIQAALDNENSGWFKESASARQLESAAMRLLGMLERTFLPATGTQSGSQKPDRRSEDRWRRRYDAALQRLQQAGIQTIADKQAGAELYIRLRMGWEPRIRMLATAMSYAMPEIDPVGSDPEPANVAPGRRSADYARLSGKRASE